MRPIYLALVSVVLIAAICFALTSFVDSHYPLPGSSAESVAAKIVETTGGPLSKLRGHDDCPGGVCHRHDEELNVKVEMQQEPAERPAKSDPPLWIPLAIGAVIFAVALIAWFSSAFDS